MATYPVIMCGGSGTRLWPASRPARPKQFIPLVGERSTFQEAVLRVRGLVDARPPLIVGGAGHADLIRADLQAIGIEAVVLLEPEPRDSAAAVAAAAAWIVDADRDGVAVLIASDHHVPDADAFRAAGDAAVAAARTGFIVTLGIRPTAPATAYGYIRAGAALGPGEARRVDAFVEKPDAAGAARYVADGYLWNSGNFVFPAALLLDELQAHAPGVADAARAGVREASPHSGALLLSDAFRRAPKTSIDYAVMEKTVRAAVVPVGFAWSDLGAWDAVHAASKRDGSGDSVIGDALRIDTRNCLIRVADGMTVAAIGVENLAIVVENGQVLICRLDRSQDVKAVTEALRTRAAE
jgi:mannose-1-phosphate guanylyltransferase/mannose-6-phosphate isomerase